MQGIHPSYNLNDNDATILDQIRCVVVGVGVGGESTALNPEEDRQLRLRRRVGGRKDGEEEAVLIDGEPVRRIGAHSEIGGLLRRADGAEL